MGAPFVSLTLHWGSRYVRSDAYLDSGAFYGVFEAGVARDLQIDLSKGKKRLLIAGDGGRIIASVMQLPISIGARKLIAEIAFSDHLKIGFNLLSAVKESSKHLTKSLFKRINAKFF